jgi:TatD DNase family protein
MVEGLVDFHCHLDLYPNHAAAVAACERARVFTLAVTTTPKAWPRNRDMVAGTKYVRAALGLHPQLVAERAREIELWTSYLHETRYVGEVGLDGGPRFFRSLPLQKQVLEHVLRLCARHGGKILTVHSTRAAKAVLDLLEQYLPSSSGKVVLHWFTGSRSEARRAVDLGCYFSVNVAMLQSERHQPMLEELPASRLLLETDGPFTKRGNRVVGPGEVGEAVAGLARLLKTPMHACAETLRANLKTLISED